MTRTIGSIALLALTSLLLSHSHAASFPAPQWKDAPNPLAAASAYRGGNLTSFAGQYPQSFNYYLANNSFCAELFSLMYDSLLNTDPIDASFTPGLASAWTISDDRLTFTFTIDPAATWSDGAPVTARDVAWTVATILDPAHLTGHHKISLERFEKPEIIDDKTIRFQARSVHWKNLLAIGSVQILPRHAFKGRNFNEINFDFPVVCGPYRLGKVDEGISLVMQRVDSWWRAGQARLRHQYNFDTITYRFFSVRQNAFDAFRKGSIDLYPVYTSRLWVKETQGDKFVKNWIVRQRIRNYSPIGFQGFATNMRRPPFDELPVRKALAHLLNRERMNRTQMYNQYFLHKSYFEDIYGSDVPCTNPILTYDPDRANSLLDEAGWRLNPTSGLREKDGKPLAFTFLTRDPSSDKFLSIFNEDLKKAGITMRVERKDWAAWAKDMDTFDFDITWAAWGASLYKDPESMWATAEAQRTSGNNITGFSDPRVDEMIEQQKSLFDIQARNRLLREVDKLLAQRIPYILLWNIDYRRLLYWNKFGTPPTVLSKYGDAADAIQYWWLDEDSEADLSDAMQSGDMLPSRPAIINFDDTFEPQP
jgi:microcin C transport system substrate-binding protein